MIRFNIIFALIFGVLLISSAIISATILQPSRASGQSISEDFGSALGSTNISSNTQHGQSATSNKDFTNALESTRTSNPLKTPGESSVQSDEDFTNALEGTRASNEPPQKDWVAVPPADGSDSLKNALESTGTGNANPPASSADVKPDHKCDGGPWVGCAENKKDESQTQPKSLPPMPQIGTLEWLDIVLSNEVNDPCTGINSGPCIGLPSEGGPRNLTPEQIEDIILMKTRPLDWIAKHEKDTNGDPISSVIFTLCTAYSNQVNQETTLECEKKAKVGGFFWSLMNLYGKAADKRDQYNSKANSIYDSDNPLAGAPAYGVPGPDNPLAGAPAYGR